MSISQIEFACDRTPLGASRYHKLGTRRAGPESRRYRKLPVTSKILSLKLLYPLSVHRQLCPPAWSAGCARSGRSYSPVITTIGRARIDDESMVM